MAIEFRLLDDGEELAVLPDVESFSLSPVLCDEGAIEFSYPRDGRNWQLIADRDEFYIAIYLDGVRQGELDALVKEVDGDDVEESSVWKFTGFFTTGRLAEAQTYPKGWPNSVNTKDPNLTFANVTSGTLVGTLLQQAQSRGTLTDITKSFTNTHDSNGVAWPGTFSIEYAPQVDYLTILKNLYVQRLAEFTISEGVLHLYVPDTLSVDRTAIEPPLVFRRGRDLTDSPRKRSTRDLGTVILAAGADGLYLERVDAPGVASRRRIETGASQGQVKDLGTLTAYADAELGRVKSAKMEKTHGLSFSDPDSPRPIRNFNVGDWAYSDMGKGNERLRIKQWVLKLGNDGELSGSVTLNDFFAERNELLTRRIEGIIGGSTITGGSKEVTPVPDEVVDGMAPAAPQGLSLSSVAYMDNQGVTFAQISASWLQVTTNSDGTILDDLDGYRVRWRYESQPTAWNVLVTDGEFASWSPVVPDVNVNVQVQAYDRAGNASPWSPAFPVTILAAKDATPPEVPAAPTVDNYLGLLRIRWNGATASGAAVAPDQNGVEVHVSTTSNFTPSNATRTDFLSTAGSSFYKGSYGVALFARLVAVDHSGNKSAPSAQGSASPTAVVSADVFDGAIGSAKLADLAVTSAKINLLAVNSAQVGSIEVGKLSAGILNAEVTVSGRIATALLGRRVEMNGIGFQGWDSSGTQTISLDGLNNLLTGRFQTALTGRRIVLGATSTTTGRIDFWSPDGDNGYVLAYTEAAGGTEAIQFGMRPPGHTNATWPALWNRININASPNGEYTTWKSGTLELSFDGGDVQKGFDGSPGAGRFVIYQAMNRTVDATAGARFQIDKNGVFYWHATNVAGGGIRLQITSWFSVYGDPQSIRPRFEMRMSDGYLLHGTNINNVYQEYLNNGNVKLSMDNGWMEFSPSVISSAGWKTFTSSGYGGLMKVHQDSRGVWWEARAWDDSGYYGIRAAAFETNSDARNKNSISDFEDAALPAMRQTKVKRYTRNGDFKASRRTKDGQLVDAKAKLAPSIARTEEIGLIAQEAPSQIVGGTEAEGLSINLYQYTAFLHKALQELADEVDGLKKGPSK